MGATRPLLRWIRRKHYFRGICRSIAIVGLILVALLIRAKFKDSEELSEFHLIRELEEIENIPCDNLRKVDSLWMLIPYTTGVIYMFLAIAIVCDECFVPALEELASERYLNLSMDIAGATLMAAGGSAPELFTSLIGTFSESEVGFGTIVGSAVFNVLFVIGMCAICSLETLTLTWWPLARDCLWYSICLCTLALFCGSVSPGRIEPWEAIVLFTLYLCYVLIMKFNLRLHSWFLKKFTNHKVGVDQEVGTKEEVRIHTFRVGLMRLLVGKESILDRAGIGMVTTLPGNVKEAFNTVDESGDGFIDRIELGKMFGTLQCPVKEHDIDNAIRELDENGDGQVDLNEFSKWYATSEIRLKSKLRQTFESFDSDKSESIDKSEMKQLLLVLGSEVDEEAINKIICEIRQAGGNDQITYNELESWYLQSVYKEQASDPNLDEDDDGILSDNLKPPSDGTAFDFIKWVVLFPIIGSLCLTIPDVREPGKSKYCYVSFFLSIVWIGGFTYLMVFWAEIIGNTLGIPMILMGLTFLAAGTSVPDLLSSVIVARMGEGDMAVSSSLGSNIFDITVGLPIPWLLFCAWPTKPGEVLIETEGIALSILILLGMLISIVVIIHIHGWKMTKSFGIAMFILYFVYLIQVVARELPFEKCDD